MSKRLRGVKQGKAFHRSVLDLIEDFEDQAKAAGLSAHEIDAHVAGTFIEILCAMAEERETYSAEGLLDVFKEALSEGAAYEQ